MAKARQVFACRSCGGVQSKWMGKCPDCNAWDALEPQRIEAKAKVDPLRVSAQAWADAAPLADAALLNHTGQSNPARPLGEIDPAALTNSRRLATGIHELDRVLGGGFVPGSAVLLGGDPGIGKSTLLLQAAGALARRGHPTLYVSSEESAEQVALRAGRTLSDEEATPTTSTTTTSRAKGVAPVASSGDAPPRELFILSDTSLARIIDQASRVLGERPEPPDATDAPDASAAGAPRRRAPVLIIDSIQMIYKADLDAFPGSLTQLRRCCAELVYFAKASGVTVVLVGHVTKDGQLAGPRLLEHLVDCVLSFEGDRYHAHRLVRAVKNRFGTTLELGLFEMTGQGLRQAPDHASVAALNAPAQPRPGTIVCPVLSGSRCLMVELQALTATGFLGAAKRKASGLDANRLAMLIAVLEQHAGLRLADRDIFASATSGVRVVEPAADLALLLAIAGAHYRRALPHTTGVVGEVGLSGEVRPVPQLDARAHEARRLGYTALLVPATQAKALRTAGGAGGLELIPVTTIGSAIELLG
jgi:DNA repair protein RadA/Sms